MASSIKNPLRLVREFFLPINFTLPLLFFVLWSSAFVTEKIIFVDVSSSATLALFFGAVNFGSSVLSS